MWPPQTRRGAPHFSGASRSGDFEVSEKSSSTSIYPNYHHQIRQTETSYATADTLVLLCATLYNHNNIFPALNIPIFFRGSSILPSFPRILLPQASSAYRANRNLEGLITPGFRIHWSEYTSPWSTPIRGLHLSVVDGHVSEAPFASWPARLLGVLSSCRHRMSWWSLSLFPRVEYI
jgi:hypothetical protein